MRPQIDDEAEVPTAKIKSFNEIGEVSLDFSQAMYLDDVLAGFDFASRSEPVLDDEDDENSQGQQRIL